MTRNPEINKVKSKDLKDIDDTERLLSEFVVPKDKNKKNLAIICKENTGCVFKWVNKRMYRFTCDEHTYFNYRSQAYITDNRIAVNIYYEGIPVPMHHNYIKTKRVSKTIVTIDGTEETVQFDKISGVNIDSQVIHYLLDRGLADEFTEKNKVGIGSGLQIIITIAILILSLINLFL